MTHYFRNFLAALGALACCYAGTGWAETYVAGQLGVSIPQGLSGFEYTDQSATPSETKASSLSLKNSVMYGAKVGHYFEGTPWMKEKFGGKPWLGMETELFNTTPDIKQQSQTAGGVTGTFQERDFRVLTWAFNLIARYPGKRWQPYAGIGLGIFFAHISNDALGDSRSSTKPGLNALLGLRYMVNEHVSAFGEYKFQHARFNFDETPTLFGINGTYNNHILAFGVGYHF